MQGSTACPCLAWGHRLWAETCPAAEPAGVAVQEMASPELQSLAMEAKKAAALVKYMPLPVRRLPDVAHVLARAPQLQPWMARGSALAYTQVPRAGQWPIHAA